MKNQKMKIMVGTVASICVAVLAGCGGGGGGSGSGDSSSSSSIPQPPAVNGKEFLVVMNNYDEGRKACMNLQDDYEYAGFVHTVMYYSENDMHCDDFGKNWDNYYCTEIGMGGSSTRTCVAGFDDYHTPINAEQTRNEVAADIAQYHAPAE